MAEMVSLSIMEPTWPKEKIRRGGNEQQHKWKRGSPALVSDVTESVAELRLSAKNKRKGKRGRVEVFN